MRKLLLVTAAFAALSVSGCSTMHKWIGEDDATPPPPASAPGAATPAPAASSQEQKEMSNVMGTSDNPNPPAVPVASVTTDDGASAGAGPSGDTSAAPSPANAPKECPQVEVLPDTKSITYFDDPDGKPTGSMVARAVLTDIKGGCDYSKDGVIVDIDMIMQGKISDKGRYEGRKDLEAFMTFPYFVAVMDPAGHMIDKKIMATAMRFKPQIDDLDHAEKITQTIPMSDVTMGPKYTITLGFQLNRAQLDYNRGNAHDDAAPAPAPAPSKSSKASSSKHAAKDDDGDDNAKVSSSTSSTTTTTTTTTSSAVPMPGTPSSLSNDVSDKYSKGDLGLPDDPTPSVVDPSAGDDASGDSSSNTGSTGASAPSAN